MENLGEEKGAQESVAAETGHQELPPPGGDDAGLTILHTSDWHLGQKFMGKSREEEHSAFLNWLADTINERDVDTLIVSGDIFDTGTPPNYALEQYYTFLTRLQGTACKSVVVVAGNHDSVATLKAPREILRLMNIHVISSGEEDVIVPIRKNGRLAGIVCAVPFLRDGVIRKGASGASYADRERALVEGIEAYYRRVHDKALALKGERDIPIIATGHFTTVGGKTSDSERDIYIGNTMNIPSRFLAEMFDYVALGHLHRSQTVGGYRHVRYSGSPIPLSFGEAANRKKVTIVTFDTTTAQIEEVDIPIFRNLYRLKGDKDEILAELEKMEDSDGWIEVEITDDNTHLALQAIQEYADTHDLTILAKKITKKAEAVGIDEEESIDLEETEPIDIFMKRLELEEIDNEALSQKLIETFKEIENRVAIL